LDKSLRKITKWNYKNENEIRGAQEYIKLRHKIVRERKANNFEMIEN